MVEKAYGEAGFSQEETAHRVRLLTRPPLQR